ncbi:hypothetical protein GPJ56_003172 [Histomonas meleagridis]|uniref:uncharacterized protein n=1 Tax=Histomonas meleagridis TaxID=135588 RepID=UPI00355AC86A|nr:hypothetical protein GPJ56_003172 [Histomonas meleagridis]KAH0801205.1 hypothetical protein GO595_005800 [Histomonas meleagridis]
MAFDTIAFCMRFKPNNNRMSINVKLIDDSMSDLPKSSGDPVFLIGATDKISSYGWEPIEYLNSQPNCEIFPLIDFDDVSLYWAKTQDEGAINFSQFFSYPSSEPISAHFVKQTLSNSTSWGEESQNT